MMRAPLVIFAAILPVAAAAGLYQLKHRVEERRAQVGALETRIAAEAEAIRVLKAEWAYLTSPDALQRNSVRFLHLFPPAPRRVMRSPVALPLRRDEFRVAASGDDRRIAPVPRDKPLPPGARRAAAPPDFAQRMRRAIARAGDDP